MRPFDTGIGVPIYPGRLAAITAPENNIDYRFGSNPFSNPGNVGLRGASGCDCDPVHGCGCTPSGLGDYSSLDQIVSNAFNWLGGIVQTTLPASASVPPQVGSAGAISTTIQAWLPYVIGGYLVYRLIK